MQKIVCHVFDTLGVILFKSMDVQLHFKKRLRSIRPREASDQFRGSPSVTSHLDISTSKWDPIFRLKPRFTWSAVTPPLFGVTWHSWVFFHVKFYHWLNKTIFKVLWTSQTYFCETRLHFNARLSSSSLGCSKLGGGKALHPEIGMTVRERARVSPTRRNYELSPFST